MGVVLLLRIRCVQKRYGTDTFEGITHIGGKYPNGLTWKFTLEEAIEKIESGHSRFFVGGHGSSAPVIVYSDRAGNKFLRTIGIIRGPNSLLNLPRCF